MPDGSFWSLYQGVMCLTPAAHKRGTQRCDDRRIKPAGLRCSGVHRIPTLALTGDRGFATAAAVAANPQESGAWA